MERERAPHHDRGGQGERGPLPVGELQGRHHRHQHDRHREDGADEQSLAQGYIPTELVRPDVKLEIEILGERRAARLQMDPPFDPQALRMRM